MESRCDNKSVGVILQNEADEYLLINRARFPYGWAAVAGHIDEHGNLEQTAVNEVYEEVGITLPVSSLRKVIENRRVENQCRRPGGDYHDWTVYTAQIVATELALSVDEVRGASWFTKPEIQQLARQSTATPATQQNSLALEGIWRRFFEELRITSK